jgi:peptidoglycan/LPS O-acetylase OafA/YrhL
MIPGLDGLRAIAFLLVFALHTNYLQIGWVATITLAFLSFSLLERPILNLKDRFFSIRKPGREQKMLTIRADL